ncbi:MAG TPA: UDP-glucose 6-dehydrogenase, partial [Propionibacteriaceae bacterium]
MLITVTGCGYLGAVHAACMAGLGHHVVGIDTDPEKAALLNAGTPVFYEPGFAELLAGALATGRLRFTTDVSQVQGSSVHF